MVLIQEYGNPQTIEGDPKALFRAFHRSNSRWSEKLGTESVFEVKQVDRGVSIRALGVTGQLKIDGRAIEIAPKFLPADEVEQWQTALLSILSFARQGAFERGDTALGTPNETTFVELLARSYATALNSGLQHGPPTTYTKNDELRGTVQGKLLSERLYPQILKNPSKVWCEIDSRSEDTFLGQFLRWAAHRFSQLVDTPSLRLELQNLEQRLAGAQRRLPSDVEIDRYFVPPQYRQFERPFEIAKWLAQRQGPALLEGELKMDGVLLKTYDVFQEFVSRCLEIVSRRHDWRYQDEPSVRLAEEPSTLTAYPDHVLRTPQGPLILDSKYKGRADWDKGSFSGKRNAKQADIYQVMAAARLVEATDVALIYPSLADSYEGPWTLLGDGHPTHLHLLEVNPAEFRADDVTNFIDTIESRLETILNYSKSESSS